MSHILNLRFEMEIFCLKYNLVRLIKGINLLCNNETYMTQTKNKERRRFIDKNFLILVFGGKDIYPKLPG